MDEKLQQNVYNTSNQNESYISEMISNSGLFSTSQFCVFSALAKTTAKPNSLCKNGVRQRIQVHFKSNWMNWIFWFIFGTDLQNSGSIFAFFFVGVFSVCLLSLRVWMFYRYLFRISTTANHKSVHAHINTYKNQHSASI